MFLTEHSTIFIYVSFSVLYLFLLSVLLTPSFLSSLRHVTLACMESPDLWKVKHFKYLGLGYDGYSRPCGNVQSL